MSDKPKFPRAAAEPVARWLLEDLAPHCERVAIAGSLRRGRPAVGDVELVYAPRFGPQAAGPGELFADIRTRANLAEERIAWLLELGVLEKRELSNGRTAFGAQNKLLVHVASAIPVDLFATSEECWFNYLVCRTGGAETNKTIATAALHRGWKWHPYGSGFSRGADTHTVASEREVFDFVGLPYLEPQQRT